MRLPDGDSPCCTRVEEITPQLPSADSKTLKSMNRVPSSRSKLVPVAFMFNLSLADLNKKYRNEIEMDKKVV